MSCKCALTMISTTTSVPVLIIHIYSCRATYGLIIFSFVSNYLYCVNKFNGHCKEKVKHDFFLPHLVITMQVEHFLNRIWSSHPSSSTVTEIIVNFQTNILSLYCFQTIKVSYSRKAETSENQCLN